MNGCFSDYCYFTNAPKTQGYKTIILLHFWVVRITNLDRPQWGWLIKGWVDQDEEHGIIRKCFHLHI